ncbi:hypothetical protein CICLE_v10033563mg [Citrus x clementina]|uniref:Wall-associated receptor kinase galacturonan-binding domain-containing protein n=1 Tax=Citrus clementina TaxID=85681 RepID=V4VB96_CITCL|nr:hypothetical protein CICLE_v10033563mg [Citrus x clementina]
MCPHLSGIPTFEVEVHNTCASGCDITGIHLNCAGFNSDNVIHPKIFFHQKNSILCVINKDEPLKFRAAVSFSYTTNLQILNRIISVHT